MTTTLPIPQTLKTPVVSLANADGTTAKTFYTAPAGGAILRMMSSTSTDTSARDIQLVVTMGGTDRTMGTIPVAITAGTISGTPAADMLDLDFIPGLATDQNGKTYLTLEGGAIVKVKAPVAVTAAKTIDFIGQAEEY